jgi:hypothetical protein
MIRRLAMSFGLAAALLAPLQSVEAATNGSVCTDGTVAAGNYTSLTITGNCSLPQSGVVNVTAGLTVAPGAVFNALTPATLNVSGGVSVGKQAIAVIGCSPAAGCNVTTSDRITGQLTADQPLALIVHSTSIAGGVSVNGGGGGVNCKVNPALAAIVGFPSPLFTVFEDNQVSGGLTVSQMQSCFFDVIRNDVNGGVQVTNNTFADPDANEIVTNTVSGNLACSGNVPAAQVGDSHGSPNTVSGRKTGECATL